jgi:hypothetical protein
MINHRRRTPNKRSAWLLLALLALLLVIVCLAVTWGRTDNKGDMTRAVTGGQNTKGEPPTNNSNPPSANTQQPNAQTGDGKNESPDPAIHLETPTGNFVSNHRPSLSANATMNEEQSVCNTTPGATCQIKFTKGNITKTLPLQITDRGGATYWSWKIQDKDIGLSTGSWQIQAVATLGNQTQTASDSLNLEVTP